MTDANEFGPEIKRDAAICGGHWPPKWLVDDVRFIPCSGEDDPERFTRRKWSAHYTLSEIYNPCWKKGIDAICLTHTHPASIAQRWNDDNPGEKPWTVPHTGKSIPSDWDGGTVLVQTGILDAIETLDARHLFPEHWQHRPQFKPIIAYRSKPSEQAVDPEVAFKREIARQTRAIIEQTGEDDGLKLTGPGVVVPLMSERDAKNLYRRAEATGGENSYLFVLRELGIIRPQTPAERFKRAHPGCDDWTTGELIEAAATFFGGEK